MNCCIKIYLFLNSIILILLGSFLLAVYFDNSLLIPPLPTLQKTWFGKTKEHPNGNDYAKEEIKSYKVDIDNKTLRDLQSRLKLDLKRVQDPSFPEPIVNSFEYGFNKDYLSSAIGKYWADQYDWRKQEKVINKMGQHFMTNIDGLDIHFLRVQPKVTNVKVLPLLMVHGWPGSFLEFKNIIPLLTNLNGNEEFVFDLIIPSIPGYGFSSAPRKPGFHVGHCARIFRELMVDRLGFKEGFYLQGGDWGAIITTALATLYPDDVRGLHINMAIASTPSVPLKQMISGLAPTFVSKMLGLQTDPSIKDQFKKLVEESGYLHLQATKPDTIGVALSASPLGLAAYILEKFSTWTRHRNTLYSDGKLLEHYSIDDLLDNVMLYWVTNSITTSMRFYKENFGNNEKNQEEIKGILMNPINDIPVGVASYSEEIFVFGEVELQGKFKNIVQFTRMTNGGHFAAMEDHDRLYKDIYQFVLTVENGKEKNKRILKNEL